MGFVNDTVISAASVAAGATNDSVAVRMEGALDAVIIYVVNNGASTDLRVTIYSSPDGTIKAALQTLYVTVAAPVATKDLYMVPMYLIFVAQNADGSNATNYSIIVSKRA